MSAHDRPTEAVARPPEQPDPASVDPVQFDAGQMGVYADQLGDYYAQHGVIHLPSYYLQLALYRLARLVEEIDGMHTAELNEQRRAREVVTFAVSELADRNEMDQADLEAVEAAMDEAISHTYSTGKILSGAHADAAGEAAEILRQYDGGSN